MLVMLAVLVLAAVLLAGRVGRRKRQDNRGVMSERWVAEYRSSHLANTSAGV